MSIGQRSGRTGDTIPGGIGPLTIRGMEVRGIVAGDAHPTDTIRHASRDIITVVPARER